MMTASAPLLGRYSEADLKLMIDFMEQAAKISMWHIESLRSKLAERPKDP